MEQEKLFKEFALSQQHVLFGKIGAEEMGKLPKPWEIKLDGVRADRGWDWSTNSREIDVAKKRRTVSPTDRKTVT